MIKLKEEIEKGKKAEFQIRDDGMIVKGQRMCVPEYVGVYKSTKCHIVVFWRLK